MAIWLISWSVYGVWAANNSLNCPSLMPSVTFFSSTTVLFLGAFPTRPHQASPGPSDLDDPRVIQSAGLNELAGNNFTLGLRAYYFAMPLVLWLLNSWLFIAGTVVITFVTYYMEFHSATIRALAPHTKNVTF